MNAACVLGKSFASRVVGLLTNLSLTAGILSQVSRQVVALQSVLCAVLSRLKCHGPGLSQVYIDNFALEGLNIASFSFSDKNGFKRLSYSIHSSWFASKADTLSCSLGTMTGAGCGLRLLLLMPWKR